MTDKYKMQIAGMIATRQGAHRSMPRSEAKDMVIEWLIDDLATALERADKAEIRLALLTQA